MLDTVGYSLNTRQIFNLENISLQNKLANCLLLTWASECVDACVSCNIVWSRLCEHYTRLDGVLSILYIMPFTNRFEGSLFIIEVPAIVSVDC